MCCVKYFISPHRKRLLLCIFQYYKRTDMIFWISYSLQERCIVLENDLTEQENKIKNINTEMAEEFKREKEMFSENISKKKMLNQEIEELIKVWSFILINIVLVNNDQHKQLIHIIIMLEKPVGKTFDRWKVLQRVKRSRRCIYSESERN